MAHGLRVVFGDATVAALSAVSHSRWVAGGREADGRTEQTDRDSGMVTDCIAWLDIGV